MTVMPFDPDLFRIQCEVRIQGGKDLGFALQVLQLVHPVTETIVHTTVLEWRLFSGLARRYMDMPAGPLTSGSGHNTGVGMHHHAVSLIAELAQHVQLLRCRVFKQFQAVVSMTGKDHPVKTLTALCCFNQYIIGTTGYMEHTRFAENNIRLGLNRTNVASRSTLHREP